MKTKKGVTLRVYISQFIFLIYGTWVLYFQESISLIELYLYLNVTEDINYVV